MIASMNEDESARLLNRISKLESICALSIILDIDTPMKPLRVDIFIKSHGISSQLNGVHKGLIYSSPDQFVQSLRSLTLHFGIENVPKSGLADAHETYWPFCP